MSTEQLKICNECKGPIVDTSRRRFCSVACMRAWHNVTKNKQAHQASVAGLTAPGRTCPFCHKAMSLEASTYGAYCSDLCRHKAAEDNDEEVKPPEKLATPAEVPQHKGICKKCNIFFTTKTLPVRKYCGATCLRQAIKDGDFKPGGPRKPAPEQPNEPTTPIVETIPTLPSPPPRRTIGDVYAATTSKLRRGIVSLLQGALNKLT